MKERGPTIYLCRHGETEWSFSGQHTGTTDIPLTDKGREQSEELGQRIKHIPFDAIYSSPLQRARETCELAGLGDTMSLEPDAIEWNYGHYEGLTSDDILKQNPSWNLFKNGAPDGESPAKATMRADRLIAKLLQHKGTVALFSHGHFLRLLAARWIGLDASAGAHLFLSVASLSILGFERNLRTIKLWNSQQ